LPEAHFLYVKADGTQELRKFLKTEPLESDSRIAVLEEQVATLVKAATPTPIEAVVAVTKETKTKRISGKDLPASDFAYVGDSEKTDTWKFPVHDAAHVRNALARFNQSKGIPVAEKSKVRGRIVSAAKKHGVDVASEQEKVAAIQSAMRKAVRIYVNEHYKTVGPHIELLDHELGKLAKGMGEVSGLAHAIDNLAYLFHAVCCEQEWEGDDDSDLPELLAANISEITKTLIEMVDEETRELIQQIKARA
jgi:hypothetical protein